MGKKSEKKADFLAICRLGSGSSFGRAETEELAVENCAVAIMEWASLFDLRSAVIVIAIYDAEGEMDWDNSGVTRNGERVEARRVLKFRTPVAGRAPNIKDGRYRKRLAERALGALDMALIVDGVVLKPNH